MILVDTTVWVDFFNNRSTPQVTYLEKALHAGENICICGIILTEILQGIRADNQYKEIISYFENLLYLPMNKSTFIKSAKIYRYLRRKGVTIRKPVDCMIAAVAAEHNIPLLHNDRDFDQITLFGGFRTVTLK